MKWQFPIGFGMDWLRDTFHIWWQGWKRLDGWQPIATVPMDGTVVWVSNGFAVRVAFWEDGKEFEHHGSVGGGWRDFFRAEAGGVADLMFVPSYWQELPKSPHRLAQSKCSMS